MRELTHLKRGPGATPHPVRWKAERDVAAAFVPGVRGRSPVRGVIDIRLAHQLLGELTEGHTPHRPFDKNNHQLGKGQARRKVSQVSRVKQALVEQGM